MSYQWKETREEKEEKEERITGERNGEARERRNERLGVVEVDSLRRWRKGMKAWKMKGERRGLEGGGEGEDRRRT